MKTYLAVAAACLTPHFLIAPAHAQQPQRAEIEQLLNKYERALNTGDMDTSERVQVLTYAVQIGLSQVLRSKGLKPRAAIGHSSMKWP